MAELVVKSGGKEGGRDDGIVADGKRSLACPRSSPPLTSRVYDALRG